MSWLFYVSKSRHTHISNNDQIGSHSQSLDFKAVVKKVKIIPVYLQGSLLKSAICTSNALCCWVQKFNTMQGKCRRRENKNRRLTYAYTRTHRTICPHTGRSAPCCVLYQIEVSHYLMKHTKLLAAPHTVDKPRARWRGSVWCKDACFL